MTWQDKSAQKRQMVPVYYADEYGGKIPGSPGEWESRLRCDHLYAEHGINGAMKCTRCGSYDVNRVNMFENRRKNKDATK